MASKRYITVLETQPILELDGSQAKDSKGEPVTCSFLQFIIGRTSDDSFVSETPLEPHTVRWGMAMIVSGEMIRSAFRDKKPGDVVEIDEDDWSRLKRATVNGSYGQGAASIIVFMKAIRDAKDER